MRILILSQTAGSRLHGMVLRNYTMAREWVRQGHDVTIIASANYHGRILQPATAGRITEETIDDIRYLWLWGPSYSQRDTVRRVLAMAVFEIQCRLARLGRQRPYDVIVCSSPPPFSIYLGHRLAKAWGARLIFDVRDLWPLSLIELGGLSRRHPFIRLVQHAEDFACRKADLVTAVPGNCESYLRSRGLGEGKFLHIGNGIIPDQLAVEPMPRTHAALLRQLRESGAFIIGYAGAIGLANAMHSVIEALARLPERFHLVIVGDGAFRTQLIDLSRRLGIAHRVHLLPPVSRSQVADILREVDVAYVGLQNIPLYEYGASLTKLNDYMLAEKPILYAGNDPDNAVARSGCGISCTPEDPESIAEGLRALAGLSDEERRLMGMKGKSWALENNMVSRHAFTILEHLNSLPTRNGS